MELCGRLHVPDTLTPPPLNIHKPILRDSRALERGMLSSKGKQEAAESCRARSIILCSVQRKEVDILCSVQRKEVDILCSVQRKEVDILFSVQRKEVDILCSVQRKEVDKLCSVQRKEVDIIIILIISLLFIVFYPCNI
jgi:hypothetical protein